MPGANRMRRESSSFIIRAESDRGFGRPSPSSTMRLTSRRAKCSALPLKLLIPVLLLCAGRAGGLDPGRAATEFARRAWQTDSGLPQNTVHSIAQTRDGYVWVATEEGLARFDGLTFKIFDRQNTPALKSNDVRALLAGARAGEIGRAHV